VLAVVVTLAMNADTIRITGTLWRDPTVRSNSRIAADQVLNAIMKPAIIDHIEQSASTVLAAVAFGV
jgi:hypothetical protein